MEDGDVPKLRRRIEALFQVNHTLPAPRAALGLVAVLRAWASRGATSCVAVPAIICHDVLAAVLDAEFSPVFLDVDPIDGNIAAEEWTRARKAGASAAIVPNLYGNAADIALARLSFPVGSCLLIDDAAQAFGTRGRIGLVGGQGDVGLISFGRTKQIDAGGGALVLCQDSDLARAISLELSLMEVVSLSDRDLAFERFRRRLHLARQSLAMTELKAVTEFDGLLDSYGAVLRVPYPSHWADRALRGLDLFAHASTMRSIKAAAWRDGIGQDVLQQVGGDSNSVPWRYACRFPGLDFRRQNELSEHLRRHRIDVSNWYLPANWFVSRFDAATKRAERFAAEVFQFWVDEDTSVESIRTGASTVRKAIQLLARPDGIVNSEFGPRAF